jgi:hypothetical protein
MANIGHDQESEKSEKSMVELQDRYLTILSCSQGSGSEA